MSPGRQYLTDAQWRTMFEAQGLKCNLCPETVVLGQPVVKIALPRWPWLARLFGARL